MRTGREREIGRSGGGERWGDWGEWRRKERGRQREWRGRERKGDQRERRVRSESEWRGAVGLRGKEREVLYKAKRSANPLNPASILPHTHPHTEPSSNNNLPIPDSAEWLNSLKRLPYSV